MAAWSGIRIVAVLVLTFFPLHVQSLFVHIKGADKKCYILEVPDDTLVAGNYTLEWEKWHDPQRLLTSALSPPQSQNQKKGNDGALEGLNVEVTDPSGSIVISKVFGPISGKFRFTSHAFGEHKMCFNLKWNRLVAAVGKYRLHLGIKVGGHAVDYSVVSKKEKLTNLQLRLRQIQDHVEQISKEQDYQRTREERFRQTSESTNRRVLVFAFFQMIIIVFMGYYHVFNLKNFFIAKKLV